MKTEKEAVHAENVQGPSREKWPMVVEQVSHDYMQQRW